MYHRIIILLTVLLFFEGRAVRSTEFPTDRGSFRLTTGTLFILAEDDEKKIENRITDLTFSADYLFGTDLSIGIWGCCNDMFTGRNSRSDIGLGPQFTYFIGGHIHKPKMHGDILPYIGTAFLFSFKGVESSGDGTTCVIVEKKKEYFGIRYFFGITVMPTDKYGFYFEWAFRMLPVRYSQTAKFGINFGFTTFLY